MEKYFSFKNILLLLIVIVNVWLVYKVNQIAPDATVYIQNGVEGVTQIDTEYGRFLVTIDETKAIKDGTEVSFILINPLNIYFAGAVVSVDNLYTSTQNLSPGPNQFKLKIHDMQIGDVIRFDLDLDRVFVK